MRRSSFRVSRLAWVGLLAASCALPELTIDSRLDDDDDSDGGTSGNNGGSDDNGGSGAGRTGGRSGEGGADPSGGSSGSDQGGNGTGGASGGSVATGGKGGATGGSGGCAADGDCAGDESCCTSECVNTDTDRDHCGTCGMACPAAQSCSDGRCGCSSGLTYCAPECVNTMTSFSDCGECDSPCEADQTCKQGQCTGPCGASFAATASGWVTAPGSSGNCWHGYAYVAQNAADVTPTTFSSCGTPCMLCMQGTVNMTSDYTGFAIIGVNLNQPTQEPAGAAVVPEGNALEISFTNSAGSLLRVQLEGPNNTDSDRWCAELSGASPQTIPYSSFRTNCWEATGQAYNKQPLRSLSITVPGRNDTDVAVGACLTGFADR